MGSVALYGAGGSPYNHAAILGEAGHHIAFVFPEDIAAGRLAGFDAFIMPGGGYRSMVGQLEPLGTAGCRAVREYVEAGGMYIGSCAGAYDAAIVPERFVASCPAQRELRLLDAVVWNDAEEVDDLQSPGIGVVECENTAPDHPVMAGIPKRFHVTHYNGPLFDNRHALARVVERGDDFTPAEDFLGTGHGSYLIDRAITSGIANIVAGPLGAGRVVLFGSHPEFGATLALDDVTPAARLLVNAVQWQLDMTGGGGHAPAPVLSESAAAPATVAADLAAVQGLATRIAEHCEQLAGRTDEPWLAEGAAMSMFGRSAREVWVAALEAMPKLAREAADTSRDLPTHLLSFRPPPEWQIDGGFHGVAPLLEQADAMLATARTAWRDGWPGRITEPYAYDMESPYHLVAGSYLAAVGRVASAALLTRAAQ
jgi:hypothetical protein